MPPPPPSPLPYHHTHANKRFSNFNFFLQTVMSLMDHPELRKSVEDSAGVGTEDPWLVEELLMTGQPLKVHFAKVIGVLCKVMHSAYGLTETVYVSSAKCRK